MRLAVFAVIGMAVFSAPFEAGAEPRVVADIPPVAALVADVLGDEGEVTVLVRPGASPHGYALRPSEAAALQDADLVIYVGEALTPWLAPALGTLAGEARQVALLDHPGTLTLETRESTLFEAHEDAHGHEDHDHHDHGDTDPHAWLDPENARRWLSLIAAHLAALDPDHAETYSANAKTAAAAITEAEAEIAARLSPLSDLPFLLFHDAFQYFETHFALNSVGAVSLGDAASPGPARLKALQDHIAETGIICAFAEPQFNPALLQTVVAGTGAEIGHIDPLGAGLDLGPGAYPALLRDMGDKIADCLD